MMKKNTYSKLLMAPLFMLLAAACTPNQFNQTTEYDDVYFTASDRQEVHKNKREARQELIQSQQQTVAVDDYSAAKLDQQIVSKYNNGTQDPVTYFEEGPLVKSAQDLNYDDFITDYQNEQLAYYELPLDWNTDWDRQSFNAIMNQDFYFRLAWYDQYYRGQNYRMSQYLNGNYGGRGSNSFLQPRVGWTVGLGFNTFWPGYVNMTYVDLNPWGYHDPFWRPIRRWGWSSYYWNDPFYCPPYYTTYTSWGWRRGWYNNVYINNNIVIDRRVDRILSSNTRSQDVRRGPRVSTSQVSTVRNDAINGSTPTTRSSRYSDNLNGTRSTRSSRAGTTNSGRATTTDAVTRSSRSTVTNGRTNRVRTDAYRYDNSNQKSRSRYVRNSSSSTSRSSATQTRASSSRSSARTSSYSSRSSRSNPSFNRSSSSRSYTNLNSSGRTSRSSYGTSRSNSSRSSYSRSSSSRSSSRSGYSRSSSSRSSSSRSGSVSRSNSGSRSSGSVSRGNSGSRSSGSVSRGSSSRSSGSRSSTSSSSSRSSSRSGRNN